MENNEKEKSKVLGLFDKEDIKYIRFDVLDQIKNKQSKSIELVKKIGGRYGNKK